MQRNFPFSADFTVSREGLYQASPADGGNWTSGRRGVGRLVGTMRGISAPTMVRWVGDENLVTVEMMKSIDQETFLAIAESLFWRALNADLLPSGIDLMLFDFGFNSGISRAARQLQQITGLGGKSLDGNIGAETLRAIDAVDFATICLCISEPYMKRLQSLIGAKPDGVGGPETLRTLMRDADGRDLALLHALASRQHLAYETFYNFRLYGANWLERLSARLDASVKLVVGSVPAV